MLQVFSINFYALLDPGATLSFLTPLMSMKFYVFSDVLVERFSVITSVGDSIVAKRVYRSCPILFPNRVKLADFVKLNMLDFDVILGMGWLHFYFSSIDCRTRVNKVPSS